MDEERLAARRVMVPSKHDQISEKELMDNIDALITQDIEDLAKTLTTKEDIEFDIAVCKQMREEQNERERIWEEKMEEEEKAFDLRVEGITDRSEFEEELKKWERKQRELFRLRGKGPKKTKKDVTEPSIDTTAQVGALVSVARTTNVAQLPMRGWGKLTLGMDGRKAMAVRWGWMSFGRGPEGVDFDEFRQGKVKRIALSNTDINVDKYGNRHGNWKLTGTIPAEIGSLVNLTELRLDGNELSGPLPSEFSRLLSLKWLNVGSNAFSGALSIVDWSTLINLKGLYLSKNSFSGEVPASLSRLSKLTHLNLADNSLSGCLPSLALCHSLNDLNVSNNRDLAGAIPKQLILRCDHIDYSGCRPRSYQDMEDGKWHKNDTWMRGPFIVGFSFASEDIGFLLYNRKMYQITPDNLKDPPAKGDESFEMYHSHGPEWCAWQEVWLNGLEELQPGTDLYSMTMRRVVLVRDGKGGFTEKEDQTREHHFRRKFCDSVKYASKKQCDEDSFDPAYRLGSGERASSILDWERRQFQRVARENELSIHNVEASIFGQNWHDDPEWYVDDPQPQQPQQLQATVGNPVSLAAGMGEEGLIYDPKDIGARKLQPAGCCVLS